MCPQGLRGSKEFGLVTGEPVVQALAQLVQRIWQRGGCEVVHKTPGQPRGASPQAGIAGQEEVGRHGQMGQALDPRGGHASKSKGQAGLPGDAGNVIQHRGCGHLHGVAQAHGLAEIIQPDHELAHARDGNDCFEFEESASRLQEEQGFRSSINPVHETMGLGRALELREHDGPSTQGDGCVDFPLRLGVKGVETDERTGVTDAGDDLGKV